MCIHRMLHFRKRSGNPPRTKGERARVLRVAVLAEILIDQSHLMCSLTTGKGDYKSSMSP